MGTDVPGQEEEQTMQHANRAAAAPRSPIGGPEMPPEISPGNLREAVDGLAPSQLDTAYREGGWTVRQLVHHIADSHSHASTRVRLALTEDGPTIKPYDEKAWANLHDSLAAPVEWSLELIEALHARWVMLLQSLAERDWERTFVHPERGPVTLAQAMLLYSWHGRHHTAHITRLRARMDW